MGEVVSSLNENFRRDSGSPSVVRENSQNPAFGAALRLRYARLKTWLDDKKQLSRAVHENDILKKALLSPIRQPIEGSRYRIGDCLFEYLPDGRTRRYKICGIQSGGISNVYVVVELNSMQPFCLKENRATFGSPLKKDEKLLYEAEISQRLGDHPNLVELRSLFYHRSRVCVVYEYVAGQSLNFHVRSQSISAPTALKYAADICRALIYADQKIPDFIHGDIKPANCLIADDGRLKLADFGHATDRRFDSGKNHDSSHARRFGGTTAYMAPELFDAGAIDRRLADVYAFGVTLYEMLAGNRPFSADSHEELIEMHRRGDLQTPFKKLEKLNIPLPVIELTEACLNRHASQRPASFQLILAELERVERFSDCPPPFMCETEREKIAPEIPTDRSCAILPAAKDFAEDGKFVLTAEEFKSLLKIVPVSVPALNLAGATCRAEVYFKQSLLIDRWQHEAYEGLCRLYLSRKMLGKAHKTAARALENDISGAFFHQINGDFYERAGSLARAVESYKKALLCADASPSVMPSFINAACRLAARTDGSAPAAVVSRLLREGALIAASGSVPDRRKKSFARRVLSLSFENKHPLAVLYALDDALVSCLVKISDERRNAWRRYLQMALGHAADLKLNFDIYYAIGKVFYHLEFFEDCEETFRLSIARNGGNENAFYYLAACREIAEDWHHALRFYKKARRFNRRCELISTGIRRVADKMNNNQSLESRFAKLFSGLKDRLN